jgi:hypothetical protein
MSVELAHFSLPLVTAYIWLDKFVHLWSLVLAVVSSYYWILSQLIYVVVVAQSPADLLFSFGSRCAKSDLSS